MKKREKEKAREKERERERERERESEKAEGARYLHLLDISSYRFNKIKPVVSAAFLSERNQSKYSAVLLVSLVCVNANLILTV